MIALRELVHLNRFMKLGRVTPTKSEFVRSGVWYHRKSQTEKLH